MSNRKAMRFAIYFLIILLLVIGSCTGHNTKPDSKNLIPEKDLISLLIDIHITDGLLSLPRINNKYTALDSITAYYHVIEKHGYTKEMMDKTMKYYFISKPKKLNKIYDEVLVKLSEMESRVEKESYMEQARISNIWKGKDFYAMPSVSRNDSANIDFTVTKPGTYQLAFSTIVYPDDQTVHPGATIYSVSPDSITTGKRKYFNTLEYLKDAVSHSYVITLNIPANSSLHFGGSFFDSGNDSPEIASHYKIENISLTLTMLPR